MWDYTVELTNVTVFHFTQNITRDFEIQTLKPGGNPRVEADWVTQGEPVTGNTSPVTEHVFAAPVRTRAVAIFRKSALLQIEEMEANGSPAPAAGESAPAWASALPTRPLPALHLNFHPGARYLEAMVGVRNGSAISEGARAEVTLTSAGNTKPILSGKIDRFTQLWQPATLDTSKLVPGKYTVTAQVTIAGVAQPLVSADLSIQPRPEWAGNTIGVTDKVPAPWTPITVDKARKEVRCWGRVYRLDAPIGFGQLNILGNDFLAAPQRLLIKRSGRETPAADGKLTWTKITPQRVEFTQTCVVDGVRVTAESWIEFDGFYWTRLELSGPAVDGVRLETPVRPEMATVWYDGSYIPGSSTGLAPDKPTFFSPAGGPPGGNFVRLGDEEHGIQWCRESLQGWKLAEIRNGIGLLPRNKEYVLQLNFIDETVSLEPAREIAFGWQGLPCRPRTTGWRECYWGGGDRDFEVKLPSVPKVYMYTERWNGRWNYWNHWNAEVFGPDAPGGATIRALREQMHDNWTLRQEIMNLYCNVGFTEANSPEYRYYQLDWRVTPPAWADLEPITDRNQWMNGYVCPGSRGYQDFYLYYLDKSLRELGRGPNAPWYGLYFDNSAVWLCGNRAHGCGYSDDAGNWQPAVPILASREYMKRVYVAAKAVDPRNVVTVHMSGLPWMAYWAFADIMIEGEQFASYWEGKRAADPQFPLDYSRMLPLDTMRAQYVPSLWGTQTMFLPEQGVVFNKDPGWLEHQKTHPGETYAPYAQSMQHLSGLLLLHDVIQWGGPDPAPWAFRAMTAWGWDDDTEFLPYWKNGNVAKVDSGGVDPVVCSLYTRPHKLLAVLMNDSDQDANVTLQVDMKRLGLEDAGFYSVYDMLNPPLRLPVWRLDDGKITVPVAKRSYRLLQYIN